MTTKLIYNGINFRMFGGLAIAVGNAYLAIRPNLSRMSTTVVIADRDFYLTPISPVSSCHLLYVRYIFFAKITFLLMQKGGEAEKSSYRYLMTSCIDMLDI